MKLIKFKILAILLITIGIGCKEEKITLDSNENPNRFLGEWSLTRVSGGFSLAENFNIDVVKWEFLENNTVRISLQQNIDKKSRVPFKVDTLLVYSFDVNNIYIGDLYEYEYQFNDSQLNLLDSPSADGTIFTFEVQPKE